MKTAEYPKVSIIIPAYNEAKYIARTLTAVTALDYPDFEVIVVDNNSTDTTSQEAAKFQNVKIVLEKNKGTQWARERGRKESTGDIICTLDADCLPSHDWLKKGVDILIQKNSVAVSGPYDYYDGKASFRATSLFFQKLFYGSINNIIQLFKIGGVMIAGNCIMKRDALEKIGGFNTNLVFYGDDTDTAKRLTKVGGVVFNNRLVMPSSARRFTSQGLIKIFSLYVFHFFKILFS